MKKKILVLNYEFPPLGGGASPVSYEIAKRLVESKKYEIDVVTMGFKDLPTYEEINPSFRVYRVKCIRKHKEVCQPWEQASYLISGYFKARELIKRNHYHIVHCHFLIPTGILALILKLQYGLSYIVSAHGSDVPGHNPDRFKTLHKFTRPLLKTICNHSQKIITPSNYLKKLIQTNINDFGDDKLIVIPNGIDNRKFIPMKKEKIILSAGRFWPFKGFQHLIKAVSSTNIGYVLHICGDGPMKNDLLLLAKKSQTKVIFHGWLNNNSDRYKKLLGKAAIYSLVSEKENASVALLEAMSAGCAVVTTNAFGCSETIGNAGLTVPYGKIVTLNNILTSLIDNPNHLHNFQKEARRRANHEFSLKKIIEQYQKLLEQ